MKYQTAIKSKMKDWVERLVRSARKKASGILMRQIICATVFAMAVGAVGYYLRAFQSDAANMLSRQSMESFDYYFTWDSFSQIEEAKSLLKAEAAQVIVELRTRPNVGAFTYSDSRSVTPEAKATGFAQAVKDMERAIAEFKGTEQELELVKDFLWLLQREENYNRWLDVYMTTLYEHPTHPLVGDFAGRALNFSREQGREKELKRAFQHLENIPLDFETKHQVSAALLAGKHWAQNAASKTKSSL